MHLENDSREEIPYDALVIDKLSDRTDLYVKVKGGGQAGGGGGVAPSEPNDAERPTAGVRVVPTSENYSEEGTHPPPTAPTSI